MRGKKKEGKRKKEICINIRKDWKSVNVGKIIGRKGNKRKEIRREGNKGKEKRRKEKERQRKSEREKI